MSQTEALAMIPTVAMELRAAEATVRVAERRRRDAIVAARAAGATWAAIGGAAGIARHRAHQIVHPHGVYAH